MQNCQICGKKYIGIKPSSLGDPTCIKCGSSIVIHANKYKSPTYYCSKCGNNRGL